MRAVWSGAITFGLVNVPVKAYGAVEGSEIAFLHTVVQSWAEGQGVGSALVRHALDDVRERGDLRVRPICTFVQRFIERNPEYADLVAAPADEA